MSEIHVCGLAAMPRVLDALPGAYLVSVLPPTEQPRTPRSVPSTRHHRMQVHDIAAPMPGHVLPEREHVEELIAFLRGADRDAPMVIHCLAGVSRSSAAAMIALALDAPGQEAAASGAVRAASAYALPNRRIVSLADEVLGRDGRLLAALDAMPSADLSSIRGHYILPRRLAE